MADFPICSNCGFIYPDDWSPCPKCNGGRELTEEEKAEEAKRRKELKVKEDTLSASKNGEENEQS